MSKRKGEAAMRVPTTEMYRYAPRSIRTSLIHLPFFLRMIVFVLCVVVLARPQTSYKLSDTETEGIDIMMTMDISVSMLTSDLSPNRLEAAKQVANEFIAGRPNDNIGLTLFGGEAFTQCPMTTNHALLLSMFKNVSCGLQEEGVISEGTAIGMGITNALSRLSGSKAKGKVVILLTDGANNTGDISPLTAAEIAKKNGVRIYTIAVGREGKMRVPIAQLPDGSYYYKTMESDMDTKTLSQIAQMTGGLFYKADSKDKLRKIYGDIDRMEKTKLLVRNYSQKHEAYQPFLIAAFLLLVTEILLKLTLFRKLP